MGAIVVIEIDEGSVSDFCTLTIPEEGLFYSEVNWDGGLDECPICEGEVQENDRGDYICLDCGANFSGTSESIAYHRRSLLMETGHIDGQVVEKILFKSLPW